MLSLKLEDFLPAYSGIDIDKNDPLFAFYKNKVPNKYDLEFPISTFLKKEFNDLSLPLSEPEFVKGSSFKPLNQQMFMARFMSPHTPYDKILVYHEVGTGKACLGAVVSELALTQFLQENRNSTKRETLILNKNKTLLDNTIKEITEKCTNGKYLPNRIDQKTGKPISDEAYVRRMNALLGQNYLFDTFEVFASKLAELDDDFIKEVYSNRIIIIDEVHNISAQYKKTIRKEKSGKTPVDIYRQFHRFLHLIKNCKVILMTATPIRDKKREIAALFNLILPLEKQFDMDTFDTDYFEGSKFKESMRKEFKNRIRGLVSYVRVTAGNVRRIPQGEIIGNMEKIPLEAVDMSPLQTKAYKKAYIKDGVKLDNISTIQEDDDETDEVSDKKRTIYTNSRQAAMFVTPDGGFGEDIDNWIVVSDQEKSNRELSLLTKEERKLLRDKQRENIEKKIREPIEEKYTKTEKKKREPIRPVEYFLTKMNDKFKKWLKPKEDTSHDEMLDRLSTISVKFAGCIRQIIENPTEKAFVYSNLVTESGTELFSAILELFDFVHIKLPERGKKIDPEEFKPPRGKRQFLLVTSEFPTTSQMRALVNGIYNHPKNIYGDYMQVIVSSKLIAEGISFFHTRQAHTLTPGWNETELIQAEGRVIRVNSHVDLPVDERYIKMFRWCAMPDDPNFPSIDLEMYKISEDKDLVNRQLERLLKEGAVDCALNAKRNMRPSIDLDNSRACDYDSCIYYCDNIPASWYLSDIDGIDQKAISDRIPKPSMIDDSYNLYYAAEEIEIIKQKVSNIFQRKFIYFYQDIINELPEASELVIIRALKELIDQSIPIINKYGIQSYLRESLNLYYLVDSYDFNSGPELYLLSWYNINPVLKENISFENWVNIYEYEYLQEKMQKLNDTKAMKEWFFDKDDGIIYLSKTFKSFSPLIQEAILESFYKAEKLGIDKNKHLREEFFRIYKRSIIPLQDEVVSTLLQSYNEKLRCYDIANKQWKYCDNEQKDKYERRGNIAEDMGELLDYYGYYGIDDPEKVLKIAENTRNITDKRKAKTQPGQTCATGSKFSASKLIALILYLGDKAEAKGDPVPVQRLSTIERQNVETEANVKNVRKLIDKINIKTKDKFTDEKYNFVKILEVSDEQLKKFSPEKLKRWYTALKYGKSKILCPTLKEWFREMNMLK